MKDNRVLLDTIALWGLLFVNSKYHRPVIELVKGKNVYVHAICFHELVYPAYRLETNGGRDLDRGLDLINKLTTAYIGITNKYKDIYGIEKLYIIPLTINDLIEAYRIILKNKDLFIEERGGYWPSIVDAIIAYTWKHLGINLITNDRKLIAYGRKHELPYIPIIKHK